MEGESVGFFVFFDSNFGGRKFGVKKAQLQGKKSPTLKSGESFSNNRIVTCDLAL